MQKTHSPTPVFALVVFVAISVVGPAAAGNEKAVGKLKITVNPKQAYVFIDGNAIRDGNQTIALNEGHHSITVSNYGYIPQSQDVTIASGKRSNLSVTLHAYGDKVSGPFGDIEFKGHPRAAVLLNGTTPSYFVGNVDEFDNNWVWHQWLLVKAGTYQVTVAQKGQSIWFGPVGVKAGERVIVDLNHDGVQKTKSFPEGLKLAPQLRFHAGTASAQVPIAPVMVALYASQTQILCGQSANLHWKSEDAIDTSIENLGNVPPSGDRLVDPKQTTTYQLIAKGSGGEATSSATISVDAIPTATLSLSQPEVRYHKIGDKVVQNDSAMLAWSSSNANSVTLDPLGPVANSGIRSIEATPGRIGDGPANRDLTYVLNVTNACGGKATRTTTLHFVSTIDPAPPVTLASVFYPTAFPTALNPNVGLVASQKELLAKAATTFKENQQYDKAGKLTVVGHADVRGLKKYNHALSERRAEIAKQYLISQGIPADKIETRAEGKEKQVDENEVERLQVQNAQKLDKWMTSTRTAKKVTWLAFNRRVDVEFEPSGQMSTQAYPSDAPDARLLWGRPVPKLKAVEDDSESPSANQQASHVGN